MNIELRGVILRASIVLTLFILAGCGILSSEDYPGPPPGAGDLDLNGVAFEQPDFDLMLGYLLTKFPFVPWNELSESIARTDVNGDGKVLTMADLVYFRTVMNGNAIPQDKLGRPFMPGEIVRDTGLYTSDIPLGGLKLTILSPPYFVSDTVINDIHYYGLGPPVPGHRVIIALPNSSDVIPPGAPIYAPGLLESIDVATPAGVEIQPAVSLDYPAVELYGNYPNPFHGETKIHFAITRTDGYTIKIRNSQGQLVRLITSDDAYLGEHWFTWIATFQPSGIYFYEISVGDESVTGKMVLQK